MSTQAMWRLQMMGTRRELLASAAFVGAVVLGFQAVDPLRNQSTGERDAEAVASGRFHTLQYPAGFGCQHGDVSGHSGHATPGGLVSMFTRFYPACVSVCAEDEQDGYEQRGMPSVQYTAEGVIVRRPTTGSPMKVQIGVSEKPVNAPSTDLRD